MICSDHTPLSALLDCSPTLIHDTAHPCHGSVTVSFYACWNGVSNDDILRYQRKLDELLSTINIPPDLLSCNGVCHNSCVHRNLVSLY